ncbi:peptidyl-prolyl cis-trans isomerase FKBP53 [Chlorella sorokiniana]|uniref:FK506-binding protein n=1 Tax=Chlorella sorokiniana TaxID=3076 RepID=A0A2P6TCX9_CHLSO|nr:peptidyl-prolyl cis-trans isomerase FKBP53 [Chlorella sorokiniana]|eukprot:PRW20488.1 peptidyl-prolyl cis-trans isomerase FKBP53 [Chlorella sorokiniana]
MAFWGCEVKPGKATPFVPPPEASKLHLSQACLSTKAKPGSKAALKVKVGDEGQPLLVCSLREGATESVPLDLIFDQYTEFSVEGAAPIHLTGYYMPEYEMDHGEDDTDEDDGEFPGGRLLGYDEYGVPIMEDDMDSEEEDSDEEFASDEESDEDEDGDLNPPRRVVIEDVTEQERGGKGAPKALPAPATNGKAAAFEDADVSGSDEEDEEESGDEQMESDESESQSEEEEEAARQAAARQAQQAQQARQKRKADAAAAAAKQPPAKAAKQLAAATPADKKQQAAQQAKTPATAPGKQAQQAQQAQQAPATAPAKQQQKEQQKEAAKPKVRSFPNGFIIEDLKAGRPDGKLAKAGKKVVMRYIGKLKNGGKVFDQTKGNATFAFRLGVGEVIKGWDRGVEGMRVGDKRRLTIPPQMAYGSSGVRGAIPPNATLVFDVELVDVK